MQVTHFYLRTHETEKEFSFFRVLETGFENYNYNSCCARIKIDQKTIKSKFVLCNPLTCFLINLSQNELGSLKRYRKL